MFGKLFSQVIKVVTLPITIAESGMDIMTGGDGSKQSKSDLPMLGNLRDGICDAIEESLDD